MRARRLDPSPHARTQALLDAVYGTVIGIMASAHLLAVSIVAARSELSASPWLVFPLGIALAVPAWWLVAETFSTAGRVRRSPWLNGWLFVALLALGLTNWPLAAPAALNLAHTLQRRRAIGRALVALAALFYLGLAVGGVLFMASGETFEEFMGIDAP